MIFLLLAIAGLVFGIGVVAISRRKARVVPQIQRAAPVEVVEATASADVVNVVDVVVEVVAAAPLSVRDRLAKARSSLSGAVGSVLGRSDVNDETWLEIEEALLRADVGVRVAQSLLGALQTRVKAKEITTPAQLIDALRSDMATQLVGTSRDLNFEANLGAPNIWLMVGQRCWKNYELGKDCGSTDCSWSHCLDGCR